VPAHFRFTVEVPKEITHLRQLAGGDEPLNRYLAQARALGEKLGPLLLQRKRGEEALLVLGMGLAER
jgi:uncharacterized protein YecE (DUF72 family)